MKPSAMVQKFSISLTAMTIIGFIAVCIILGGYIIFLRNTSLRNQHSELQYLRQENRRLMESNLKFEQQIKDMQESCNSSLDSDSGTDGERIDMQSGHQRSFIYTVKKGDTIWDIATLYDVEVKDLMQWNKLGPRSQIFPGDQLVIILNE